jgi:hypothetical protein
MTAAVGARNLFKVDAGVVHALLQARYYDGSKGEFLSEDLFSLVTQNHRTNRTHKILTATATQVTNPIRYSDPSGLLTIIVPRTKYDPKTWSSSRNSMKW